MFADEKLSAARAGLVVIGRGAAGRDTGGGGGEGRGGLEEEETRVAAVALDGRSGSVVGLSRPAGGGWTGGGPDTGG